MAIKGILNASLSLDTNTDSLSGGRTCDKEKKWTTSRSLSLPRNVTQFLVLPEQANICMSEEMFLPLLHSSFSVSQVGTQHECKFLALNHAKVQALSPYNFLFFNSGIPLAHACARGRHVCTSFKSICARLIQLQKLNKIITF